MTTGDRATTTDSIHIPTVGGHYRLFQLLGEIGDGSLYHALDTVAERRLGVLLLDDAEAMSPGRALAYMEATEAAEHELHPAVVRLDTFAHTDAGLYVTTERLEGTSLRSLLLSRGPLPLVTALEVTIRLADVLASLHRARLVHGALCAEVTVVHFDGRLRFLKVLPGALAVRLLEEKPGDESLATVGPAHLSPEVLLGEGPQAASDLFTLGVLLFEMLTGDAPFDGPNRSTVTARIISEEPPGLRAAGYDGPLADELDEVLLRLLAKRPEQRPASAEAVILALRPFFRAAERQALHSASTTEVRAVAPTTSATRPIDRSDAPPGPVAMHPPAAEAAGDPPANLMATERMTLADMAAARAALQRMEDEQERDKPA